MVDVTHDRDHRRTNREIVLVALVLAELNVEGLQQFAVLVLGGDDLDYVVEFLAEQFERLVADRLGRRNHLAEREQHLDQGSGIDVDALSEVGQGRAARQTNGLAVALADAHTANRRGLHGLELHATRTLGLASTARGSARATEGTLGLTALTGATAAGATAASWAKSAGATWCARSTRPGTGTATTRSAATPGSATAATSRAAASRPATRAGAECSR